MRGLSLSPLWDGDNGGCFQFDLGRRVEKVGYKNHAHCRIVISHQRFPDPAQLAAAGEVSRLVNAKCGYSANVVWPTACGRNNGENILQRLLELRDKVAASGTATSPTAATGHGMRAMVVEALVGLGFPAKQAEDATDSVLALDDAATTSSALRSALSLLGKTK